IFNLTTSIDTTQIYKSSRLVSELTGFLIQPNKAIVGANAFRHQSGIHQDGIIKKAITYEIIEPKTVGIPASSLVLSKLSGKHAFRERLAELGYTLSEEALLHAFRSFKEIADKKKEVTDSDLIAILEEETTPLPQVYSLLYFHTSSGTQTIPTATIKLKKNGKILEDASCGDGPVDAAYRTIDRMVGLKSRLLDYKIKAVTSGKDALGEVSLKLEIKKRIVAGRAVSTDIIEASAKAYLNAINRYLATKK
ncbi:MAG: 2-isopropylmalate synthase, partial [Candidatus Omnitrophica bacterium]|nr:2-isopropylmalate synthase [Candidatus Omnitrophota bacterium]